MICEMCVGEICTTVGNGKTARNGRTPGCDCREAD